VHRGATEELLRAVVRLAIVTFASLVSGALLAGPALAQGSTHQLNPRDQIVLNGELTVAEGETVDTAVLGHGTATIDGTVTGAVVVFDGPTDISGTVHGDVFVFNGAVTVRSGAVIDGDLVTRQIPTVESGATIRGQQQRVSTRFNTGDLGLASRVIWWIGYSVSTLVLGLLLLLLAPALDPAIVRASRERVGGAIGFGVALFFLLPIVAVLFLVVIVAIPLGLFLLLALALLYTVGYVAGAHAIGRRLVKSPTSSRFAAFLAGWAILRVFGLIPVIGGIVWTLLSIFGLGLLWVAARRSPPAPMPEQPAMPPPAPMVA
jgi:cytoskeletal protein CcmA (bactofilin family)